MTGPEFSLHLSTSIVTTIFQVNLGYLPGTLGLLPPLFVSEKNLLGISGTVI